jgi:hypothetical protein
VVPHQLEVIVSTSAETFVSEFVLDKVPEARHRLAAVMAMLAGIVMLTGVAAAAVAAVALATALRGLATA